MPAEFERGIISSVFNTIAMEQKAAGIKDEKMCPVLYNSMCEGYI